MSAINNKEGNQGIWWHPENLGPLKSVPYIKQFGSMKFSKVRMDENMRPHLNDGIEIHFVKSGKYKWVVDNTEVELLPDNLSVTTPWQLNGSPEGKMDIGHINWIVIKPEEFSVDTPLNLGKWTKLSKKFQENLGSMMTSENVIVIEKAKVFKKYFIELEKELKNQEKGFKTMVGNIIENFFIDLNRYLSLREQQISEEDNFIERLTQVVNKDLNKKWIIEDLATLFGMGKTKFTYEVKKLTGYPPNSFIINLKIEKAIEMIKASNYSMSDIAFACGFSSVQHFSSTFSQRIGVRPANYQK